MNELLGQRTLEAQRGGKGLASRTLVGAWPGLSWRDPDFYLSLVKEETPGEPQSLLPPSPVLFFHICYSSDTGTIGRWSWIPPNTWHWLLGFVCFLGLEVGVGSRKVKAAVSVLVFPKLLVFSLPQACLS